MVKILGCDCGFGHWIFFCLVPHLRENAQWAENEQSDKCERLRTKRSVCFCRRICGVKECIINDDVYRKKQMGPCAANYLISAATYFCRRLYDCNGAVLLFKKAGTNGAKWNFGTKQRQNGVVLTFHFSCHLSHTLLFRSFCLSHSFSSLSNRISLSLQNQKIRPIQVISFQSQIFFFSWKFTSTLVFNVFSWVFLEIVMWLVVYLCFKEILVVVYEG